MVTEAYRTSLEEAKAHHAASKTYSGKFLRPHKPFILGLIAEHGITSAIDYGCGKGEQYRWVDPEDGMTLEQAFGFEVRKFDPAYPPYAEKPAAGSKFDLVMCSHVLPAIPVDDLKSWFLDEVIGYGSKVVYFAEKLGFPKKTAISAPELRAVGWSKAQFKTVIGAAAKRAKGPMVYASFREVVGDHVEVERWKHDGQQWTLAWSSENQGAA